MQEDSVGFKSRRGILSSVITDDRCLQMIKDAVIRTHRITIYVYQFIKAYYLYCFENGRPLPTINENFIKLIFTVISITNDKRGGHLNENNKIIISQLREFYNSHFRNIRIIDPISRTHLSQIILYSANKIRTMIENNIKMHFIKRLNGFVNIMQFRAHENYIDQLPTKKAKKDFKQDLHLQLKDIKNDIINNTLTSDPFFHPWVQQIRELFIPPNIKVNVPYDLKAEPMKFLPAMILMNRKLEDIGRKQFRCFPLRNDIIPAHIELDTTALAELFRISVKEKGETEILKRSLWGDNFDLSHRLFKSPKNMTFHHMIRTDGISIVTLFAPINYKKLGRKKKKDLIQNEESPKEFPHLTDLNPSEIERIRNDHRVYVYPNKGNLIYCIDDNNVIFRYTRWQRMHESGRSANQQKVQAYKENNNMIPIETQLSVENSKTCYFNRFMDYLRIKNQVNRNLFQHYDQEFFRKLRLKAFINTKQSEDKMINNLKKKYQTDDREIVLIYGDCNVGKQMKNVISTPMIGMKRRLARDFKVVQIDEYRTSCLHWNWEVKNKNVKITKANGETKKLNSVLVSEIPDIGRSGFKRSFINRDRNAVLNMRKITHQFLLDGTRPLRYQRGYKLESSQDSNSEIDSDSVDPETDQTLSRESLQSNITISG